MKRSFVIKNSFIYLVSKEINPKLRLISIFCDVDDFCKQFEPEWKKILIESKTKDVKRRNRKSELFLSEAITIVIMFHKTRYRTFKDFYYRFVIAFLRPYFPNLLSYSRFVNLWNFLVNLVSGIVAYAYDSSKPTIQLTRREKKFLLREIVKTGI